MHANNEIGNMTNIKRIGELAQQYNAVFHADTVQTVGHFPINLAEINVDFITGASHKFHGPKGVGILYINANNKVNPFIHGGGQERNMRAGTENIYGIVGFAKALEISMQNHEVDHAKIAALKSHLKSSLQENIKGVVFNGDPEGESLYTVLSVGFPRTEKSEMLLFNLDIRNICVSGGSACSSGANQGSHVINALQLPEQSTVRFSFSKYNTKQEVDAVIEALKELV
jgi:cysteine desulfurase